MFDSSSGRWQGNGEPTTAKMCLTAAVAGGKSECWLLIELKSAFAWWSGDDDGCRGDKGNKRRQKWSMRVKALSEMLIIF